VRLEGLGKLKNAITSLEIEPAIFRHAASASTNYATARHPDRNMKNGNVLFTVFKKHKGLGARGRSYCVDGIWRD
jgi:hypothetical protein